MAPEGMPIKLALSCCPVKGFKRKTIGCPGLRMPSLSSGLSISIAKVSAVPNTGVGGVGVVTGTGFVGATGGGA